MDRTYWCEFELFLPGEIAVGQQRGIRLYDGDERVLLPEYSYVYIYI